jgi:hypothetical protein
MTLGHGTRRCPASRDCTYPSSALNAAGTRLAAAMSNHRGGEGFPVVKAAVDTRKLYALGRPVSIESDAWALKES